MILISRIPYTKIDCYRNARYTLGQKIPLPLLFIPEIILMIHIQNNKIGTDKQINHKNALPEIPLPVLFIPEIISMSEQERAYSGHTLRAIFSNLLQSAFPGCDDVTYSRESKKRSRTHSKKQHLFLVLLR
jgi:hypothetical protein